MYWWALLFAVGCIVLAQILQFDRTDPISAYCQGHENSVSAVIDEIASSSVISSPFDRIGALINVSRSEDSRSDCFFSQNYFDAREQFVSAASRAGADLVKIPLSETISTDVAIIKGREDSVILHISGIHGTFYFLFAVEHLFIMMMTFRTGGLCWKWNSGYLSAHLELILVSDSFLVCNRMQNSFLNIISRVNREERLAHWPTIVMVHGANAHGFANNRRFTEENVDLNRYCNSLYCCCVSIVSALHAHGHAEIF